MHLDTFFDSAELRQKTLDVTITFTLIVSIKEVVTSSVFLALIVAPISEKWLGQKNELSVQYDIHRVDTA